MSTEALVRATGIHHVRLTVVDIARSKAFYTALLGSEPAADFSEHASDPAVHEDPARLYGGAVFQVGDQIVGLRPVADAGDVFRSTRTGLDHLSLSVASVDDLRDAGVRLSAAGVEHGEVIELADMGIAILSIQDPDDINLELTAPLGG